MFLCYNINTEQKFEEVYIMKKANETSHEKLDYFIEVISHLTDKQLNKLLEDAIKLKIEELENTN